MAENTLVMPEAIQRAFEANPELLKAIVNPEFINSINDKLSARGANADWCIACGASRSPAPALDVINPPSIEEIRQIAQRLSLIR